MCLCSCQVCIGPCKSNEEHRMPWNWNKMQLLDIWYGCWEPNWGSLKEHNVLLTTLYHLSRSFNTILNNLISFSVKDLWYYEKHNLEARFYYKLIGKWCDNNISIKHHCFSSNISTSGKWHHFMERKQEDALSWSLDLKNQGEQQIHYTRSGKAGLERPKRKLASRSSFDCDSETRGTEILCKANNPPFINCDIFHSVN